MTKQEYMKNINWLLLQCKEESIFQFIQSFMEKQVDTKISEIPESELNVIDEYFEKTTVIQIEADEARDEAREIIEQLDVDQIRYINTFMKRHFGIDNVEPYGGDLSASYRNGIREQIAYCEDDGLLDLIWKILFKSQPQDEDVAEHHKWS